MDEDSADLLKAWGFEEYIPVFKEQKIDSAALSLLTDELIKELIKPIGDRAKFCANLHQWRGILAIANGTNLITDVSFNSEDTTAPNEEVPSTSRNEVLIEIPITNEDLDSSGQSTLSPKLQSPEVMEILQRVMKENNITRVGSQWYITVRGGL